jgi:hypothetical protein
LIYRWWEVECDDTDSKVSVLLDGTRDYTRIGSSDELYISPEEHSFGTGEQEEHPFSRIFHKAREGAGRVRLKDP